MDHRLLFAETGVFLVIFALVSALVRLRHGQRLGQVVTSTGLFVFVAGVRQNPFFVCLLVGRNLFRFFQVIPVEPGSEGRRQIAN